MVRGASPVTCAATQPVVALPPIVLMLYLCILKLCASCVRFLLPHSFIAVETIDTYSVLISSKVVYFLKPGEYADREAIFLEVKYDDLYHCLVSKDHGKVYVQLTKKADSTSSGVAIPGPSHQKPLVSD